uniref:Reverse transcriptase domain-containing protein n=1 Tax=Tanacetum cinerariifolium TaxID=118510 RepID=A0A6L2NF68_TANCI|nr:reverse transcriptase domain-containing protein [Tanacetum cinerariifolium]
MKKEVIKLLDAKLIYPISDSPWFNPVHYVPKKDDMTVVTNEDNELIPARLVTGCRVCIDYRKLNDATRKDHFPLPIMDQMLKRLVKNEFYCLLVGFSGYFQITFDQQDQEKTTFTCAYGTFAYRRMPFGLCNAPGMFQRLLAKWVEAKALPTNDAQVVGKFLKSLFARFRTPGAIISGRGKNRASWSDKLDDALWAFHTAFKTPIGISSDYEDSRARGFILHSLELQSLA